LDKQTLFAEFCPIGKYPLTFLLFTNLRHIRGMKIGQTNFTV